MGPPADATGAPNGMNGRAYGFGVGAAPSSVAFMSKTLGPGGDVVVATALLEEGHPIVPPVGPVAPAMASRPVVQFSQRLVLIAGMSISASETAALSVIALMPTCPDMRPPCGTPAVYGLTVSNLPARSRPLSVYAHRPHPPS